jgi:hypothetical protein
MIRLLNRMVTIVFFTILLAGTAATASAQQAHFRLPFEAKWGWLVLPPGDYAIQARSSRPHRWHPRLSSGDHSCESS